MKLFESTSLGQISLKNRIVMAPMTRSRAIGNVPNELMATYYSQRAGAGFIITEGVSPSPNGLGYARIPGLFDQIQAEGWKKVTEAVHAKGARIFVQLMHTGRVSHAANMPADSQILAPSAIALSGQMWTDAQGQQPHPTPKAMTIDEIKIAVGEFARAAELAVDAGFDGVELHAANGYLIEQFLNPSANQRNDEYGGSDENRMRFALEVAEAVARRIGAARVGIRVSPYGVFNDMKPFEGVDQFYAELSRRLSALGLVYVHVVDHSGMGAPPVSPEVKQAIRREFKGVYILSGNYDRASAARDLEAGRGDLVAFGRPFISNPDLVEKLRSGEELKKADPTKFYTPGPEGYTDY
ncbi:MAG: alkene reductase [Bdellovibrionaceae bacterium]|nr:alkene reductase [Pseudobdellovibrionaceae bacterium]